MAGNVSRFRNLVPVVAVLSPISQFVAESIPRPELSSQQDAVDLYFYAVCAAAEAP